MKETIHINNMDDLDDLPTIGKPMNKMKQMLLELDKGEYDNFTDTSLLTFELMKDFKINHTLARYTSIAFFHYKDRINKTLNNDSI